MTKVVAALLLTVPLAIPFAGPAKGASLVVNESALQKVLDSKFPDGKIPIGKQDDCNNPYIETVHITIDQGRVHVAGHLSGHIGGKIAGVCVAPADPSNFTLSGIPTVSGTIVKLTGIQLDSIEKRELAPVIGLILANFAGDAVQVDLKSAAEGALNGSPPYQITLDNLVLQSVTAQDKALTLDFDFKLSIQ
ncbi:MAG: hypothetical protein ACXV8H_07405 [Chthoniobacterales bacterium]